MLGLLRLGGFDTLKQLGGSQAVACFYGALSDGPGRIGIWVVGRNGAGRSSDRIGWYKSQCNRDSHCPVVCFPKPSISQTATRMAGEATALGRSGSAKAFNSLKVG